MLLTGNVHHIPGVLPGWVGNIEIHNAENPALGIDPLVKILRDAHFILLIAFR